VSEEIGDPWDVPAPQVAEPEAGSLPGDEGESAGLPQIAGKVSVRRNRFAPAGAACSPVPVLGAALSVAGLVKSKAVGGKGRKLSIAGLALSVVFAGLYTLTGLSVEYSAAWDDGCRRALGYQPSVADTFERDSSAIARADASASSQVALPATEYGTYADAQGILKLMTAAEAQSSRRDVRADLVRVEQDINVLIGVSADAVLQRDWTSAAAGILSALHRLTSDAASLADLCGDYLDFL
jgi:hypothetical protein